jgi:hopene-associated glycosyltransferase HpnB
VELNGKRRLDGDGGIRPVAADAITVLLRSVIRTLRPVVWLAALPLIIWVYLLLFRGGFWRTGIRLPIVAEPPSWPSVAVVVPARNEEFVLGDTLPTLLVQDYPGPLQVVLVDDRSTDETAAVARRLGAQPGARVVPVVVEGEEPPPGWSGKLWALAQGVSAVSSTGLDEAPPLGSPAADLLLLTDADIAHPPSSVRHLVAWAEAARLDQVSLMARLRVRTGWERLLIPAFVYFFAQLYPFRWVNRPGHKTAAAAGGCVLVRRQALVRAGGISAIHGAVIDDVALAKALKGTGSAIWIGLADDVRSVRPYLGLGDLWDMVARSAYTQLGFSFVLLLGTVVGLAITFLGPIAAVVSGLVAGSLAITLVGIFSLLAMELTYLPTVRYHRLGSWRAAGLPVAACLYGAMTVTSAWRHYRKGVAWKGRHYGALTD